MASALGMSGFTLRSGGALDTRGLGATSAALGASAVRLTPKYLPETTVNLSKVSHETERVALRHVALGQAVSLDSQHLAQASDELREARERIRAVTARLARNQRALDAYHSDCAPLVAAYRQSLGGMKETLDKCAAGHAKSAWWWAGWRAAAPREGHPAPASHTHATALPRARRHDGARKGVWLPPNLLARAPTRVLGRAIQPEQVAL